MKFIKDWFWDWQIVKSYLLVGVISGLIGLAFALLK